MEFLPPRDALFYHVMARGLPALLMFLALLLTYRFVPRRDVDWRAAVAGAAAATALFVVAQPLFLGYMRNFAEFNLIYGSLAIIVSLVVWAWLVSLIVLFGGSLAARVQSMFIEGLSADEVRRRHEAADPGPEGSGARPKQLNTPDLPDRQRSTDK